MRENLSAPGNISDWLKISKQACKNLNYYNIVQDPTYARITARYGYDDYIIVNLRNKPDNRVLLEFDVSDPNMIDQFKTASAQIIRKIQDDQRQKEEELKYGPTPVDNFNPDEVAQYYETTPENTGHVYVAEEGDFIEQTRRLPDDTLQLKQYRKELDKLEEDSFRHKFRQYFNKLWVIWVMLIVLPPFGIFLLWYFHRMSLVSRILLSALSFFYFFMIWIGFFGIDTGFNRDTLQRFYQNQQYNYQRFLNQFNPGTDPEQAIQSVQPPEETESPELVEPGLTQDNSLDTARNDFDTIFNGIGNFFKNIFGSSSP